MRRTVFSSITVVATVGLWSSSAWAGEPQDRAEDLEVDGPEATPEIYGGTPVNSCGWPTTAFLGGCTATLVHPQVVVYAAHCGGNQNSVGFGESQSNLSRVVPIDYCRTNPQYGGASGGKDHAFCVLSNPVTDIPIVPVLMGCETNVLQPGKEVTIVGFGQADAQPSFGVKREVTTTINSIGLEAFIGGNGKDSCQGDSGGPVYVKLPDGPHGGAWRVFGITSYGGQCGGGGYYSMMHLGMEWMQSELEGTGIDLTPCHTADGTWDPGPECGFFPEDPATGGGSWNAGCGGGPVGGYSSTCGPSFNAEPDTTAPVVEILLPGDGDRIDGDGINTVPITVTASADDGDGWGVDRVELYINGELIAEDASDPYSWDLNMPSGGFEIQTIAVDRADNASKPDTVRIGIDQDAPEPPPSGDGDGDGDGGSGGDGGGDGDGDGGADDGLDGGAEGGTGFGAGGDDASKGCSVAADAEDHRGLAGLFVITVGGLVGLGRRRRARSAAAARAR